MPMGRKAVTSGIELGKVGSKPRAPVLAAS